MGKGGSVNIGYWYRVGYHHGISGTPIDAFLEFRGGDKTAWSGELTASGIININAPYLWGGEKDQGGIVGQFEVMFGDADQQPNSYLLSTFGSQVPGWRGVTTGVFRGGRFGAMNPYPQKPAYKIRAIKKGWDNDTCWYPEKAEVVLASSTTLPSDSTGWDYQVLPAETNPGYNNLDIPTSGWTTGAQAPFAGGTLVSVGNTNWHDHTTLWVRRSVSIFGINQRLTVRAENGCVIFINGALAGAVNRSNSSIPNNQTNTFVFPLQTGQTYELAIKAFDETDTANGGTELYVEISTAGLIAMNPAHLLYEARTAADRGAEPIESMADASWRAGADWFAAQGFGLCTNFDPDGESVDSFIARIERVAGCSVNRSPVDGLWYLDIANGVYDLDSLPILTDDDILSWEHTPSIPDDAVNSLSVEFEDVQQKVTVTTPPVRALALISANGLNHDVRQFHELPTGELATRVAQRELAAVVTPTRAFTLTTTRKPYNWRRYTYFRLQAPRMGIADMVCLLAEKNSGTLKSGAMKISAVQDIYSLTTASFAEIEEGVDTRPPQIPLGIVQQAAFEAPYIELARRLPAATLDALGADAAYLMAIAKDPNTSRDYTMLASSDGGTTYREASIARWCPNGLIVEGDARIDGVPATAFTLSGGDRLDGVAVSSAAWWDGELVQVDAIDVGASTITLGRGCADTTPIPHAAGARIWFYDGYAAEDRTEYTDGETVDVLLLTNTGTQQLDPSLATPLEVTFAQRQSRPYPPGKVRIGGLPYPSVVADEFAVTWVHRNRVTQADQLVDTESASVTPAPNTRYALRFLDSTDTLLVERTDIGDTTATVVLNATGDVTMELYTIDEVGASLQKHVVAFAYTPPGGTVISTITAAAYTPVDDSNIIDGGTV